MSILKVKKFIPHLYEHYELFKDGKFCKSFSTYRDVVKFTKKEQKPFQIKALSLTAISAEPEILIERT